MNAVLAIRSHQEAIEGSLLIMGREGREEDTKVESTEPVEHSALDLLRVYRVWWSLGNYCNCCQHKREGCSNNDKHVCNGQWRASRTVPCSQNSARGKKPGCNYVAIVFNHDILDFKSHFVWPASKRCNSLYHKRHLF